MLTCDCIPTRKQIIIIKSTYHVSSSRVVTVLQLRNMANLRSAVVI